MKKGGGGNVIFPADVTVRAKKPSLMHQSSFLSERDAAAQNHLAEIADLIRNGDSKRLEIKLNKSDVETIREAVDSKNFHSLHHVGRSGDINMAKLFLNKKFDANFPQPSTGKTALHFAVESDNLSLAKFLINQSKVNVDSTANHEINFAHRRTNMGGNNILHIAVSNENFEMVKMILSNKRTRSLWEQRNNVNCTPLELALFMENANIATEILGYSTRKVNTDLNKDGDPLLHWALKSVDCDFLRSIAFLKTPTLDMKTRNRFGQPILAALAKLQMLDSMKLLMESSITRNQCLNTKSSTGETALYVATSYELPRVVQYLISAEVRADVNIANDEGMTPLMAACLQNKKRDVTLLLLNAGADVSMVNKAEYSPLHQLTVKDDLEDINVGKAKLVLKVSEDALEKTEKEFGFTPAFMAAVNSKYKLLDLFLSAGKAINQLNYRNETLLHVTTIQESDDYLLKLEEKLDHVSYSPQGNTEMCEKLLKWKLKIGQQDSEYGQTVLHIAARNFLTTNQIKLFSNFLTTLEKQDPDVKQSVLDSTDECKQTALHKAVVGRNIEITEILINAGTDVTVEDEVKNTPLLLSVLVDDVTAFNLLLPKNDLYQKNTLNQTVLHLAAIQESAEITRIILTKDWSPAFVNAQDVFGRTALHYAAEGRGSLQVAEILLNKDVNADTEIFDQQRESPLDIAMKNPVLKMIDIFMTGGGSSKGSLREALKLQRTDLIKSHINQILEEGTDSGRTRDARRDELATSGSGEKLENVKLTSKEFRTTAEKFYEEIMKQTDLEGTSALHIAAADGNIDMLFTILNPMGDDDLLTRFVALADRNGDTPLHVAIAKYQPRNATGVDVNYPEVKSLLLQKGFAINTPNNKYETCLHIAAANGALAVFIELMERGANPNLRDSLGYNCLHIACKNGNINVVKYLLFRGADINACTYENNSALHICALYNASEIAELLIEKGIDQSIVNGKSKTAQAIAIEQNHTNFIRSLWQLNSDKKGYVGPKEPISSREVYSTSLKHGDIKSKFPSIIEEYPILAEQVLDYYLIPMAKAYMYRKWVENTVYFYTFTFILYFLTALSHTIFMMRIRRKLDGYTVTSTDDASHIAGRWFALTLDSILYAVTCVLCLIGLLTEVLTFVLLGVRYIRRRINWIELIFFLFMLAILVYHYVIITVYQKESVESFKPSDSAFFWLTLVMFCLWVNVGFHTRQNQYFGIYIVMLSDIIVTFARLVVPVTFFILAPTLAYYVLDAPTTGYFKEPLGTLFKSLNLVIGNVNGDEYENSRGDWIYALQSFVTAFFMIFITIIIMNLITAVAIGDVTAAEMNAIQTKLQLSANLIIETEFMRRKLFRSSRVTEEPQIFDMEFEDSIGLELLLKILFGSPVLAKTSIIKEIEERYLAKYDFGLAEPEEETALVGISGSSGLAQSGFNPREMQNLMERELKRQQNAIVREMAQIIQKDMENLITITEKLGNSQNESNESIVTKVNDALKNLGDDIKKYVPSAEQQNFQAKLASITQSSRAKRKVEAVEDQLKDMRETVSQVERSLDNYKDFFKEMNLESTMNFRRQNMK